MQRWFAPLFVLALFSPLVGWSAGDTAADKVVSACGKPRRDYTFPLTESDTYRSRFLAYKGETVWFTGSLKGEDWNLIGWSRAASDLPTLGMDGADKDLPCLKKLPATVMLRTDPRPTPAATPASTTDNSTSEAWGDGVLVVLAFAAGLVFYFIPCLVANNRKVNADGGIIALNIFLGWTLIGWVAALIWANTAETESEARLKKAALENMARFSPPPSS
jgi:hypothetical protein